MNTIACCKIIKLPSARWRRNTRGAMPLQYDGPNADCLAGKLEIVWAGLVSKPGSDVVYKVRRYRFQDEPSETWFDEQVKEYFRIRRSST